MAIANVLSLTFLVIDDNPITYVKALSLLINSHEVSTNKLVVIDLKSISYSFGR